MNHKSCRSFDKIYNKEEKNIFKKQFNNIDFDFDKNLMEIYNNNNYIIPRSEDKNNIFKLNLSNILNNNKNNLESTKIKEINIKKRNVFNFNKIKNQTNKQISIDSNNKLPINKEEFSFKNMNIINPNLNSKSYLNFDRNINLETGAKSQQNKYNNIIKSTNQIYNKIKVNNAIKRAKINSDNINLNISNLLNNKNRMSNKKINIIINNNMNSFSKNPSKRENLINKIYLKNEIRSNDYKYVNRHPKEHYNKDFIKLVQKKRSPIELTCINKSNIFTGIKGTILDNSSYNITIKDIGINKKNNFQIRRRMNILDYRPLYHRKQKSHILNSYSYINDFTNTSPNPYLNKNSLFNSNNYMMNNEANIIELNKRILRQNRTPPNEYDRNNALFKNLNYKNNYNYRKGVIKKAKNPYSNCNTNIIKNHLKSSSDIYSYMSEYKNKNCMNLRLGKNLQRHISPIFLRNNNNLNYVI